MIEISKCKKHKFVIDSTEYTALDFPDHSSVEALRANLIVDLHDKIRQATITEATEEIDVDDFSYRDLPFYGSTNEEDSNKSHVCALTPDLVLYSFGGDIMLDDFIINVRHDSYRTHIPEYKKSDINIDAFDYIDLRDISFSVFFDKVWKIGFNSQEDYFQFMVSQ